MSKYGNQKTEIDGYKFDSKKEAQRYADLKLLQRAGEISELTLQPEFDIVINGFKVCAYRGDFQYVENGATVIEDVKSEATRKNRAYRIKCKLMKAVLGIEIREII